MKLLKFQEVFGRLPLPYMDEEFNVDSIWKDMENKVEPPPYMHIRRSILFYYVLHWISYIFYALSLYQSFKQIIAYLLKNLLSNFLVKQWMLLQFGRLFFIPLS